jgi:PAS domain S-box-containing protein
LDLCAADGHLIEDPRGALLEASDGLLELDHELTVSSEIAAALGLGALWYRVRRVPGNPSRVELTPRSELAHLLEVLAPDLEFAALAVCDPIGRLAAVNGTAQHLLGYVADGPLLGRSLEGLLGQPSMLSRQGPHLWEVEIPIDRREMLTLEVNVRPYHDSGGRASGWLVRFHSKPFLASAVIDWQSLVEHFPGIVLRLDREGRVIFANRRVGSFTVEEVQGRGVFEFVRDDSRVTVAHFRDLVVRGKSSLAGELPVHDPRTQETIWYSFNAVPILRGDDVEVLVYATDISLRVQAEEDLENSKKRILSLSSRLDRAQEEERRRISRELHDELGGMLTALRLEMGALEKVDGLPQPALDKLDAVEEILTMTLSTVRRLSTQLRPQILDDLGLPAALESLLRDASRRSEFVYDFQVPRSLPGSTDLHLHLYRICQEALTNVCRHARAGRVRLLITRPFRGRLRLVIEDDGTGYQPEVVAEKMTMGLSGIAERVQLLGGTLEMTSGPGQGCRLKVEVPLTAVAVPCEPVFSETQWPVQPAP